MWGGLSEAKAEIRVGYEGVIIRTESKHLYRWLWRRTVQTSHMDNVKVYTIAEVAAMTGYSRDTVTRLFEDERGVLIISRPTTNRKRRYRSIRIPAAVYERVVARLTVK